MLKSHYYRRVLPLPDLIRQFVRVLAVFLVVIVNGSATPPLNDNFDAALIIPAYFTNAVEMPGTGNRFEGDNSLATSEPGEPQHSWRGDGKSLWWQWTAPENGSLYFDLQQSYVPAIVVYRGDSLNTLEPLGKNPRDGFYFPSSIFSVGGIRKGETYHFAFDGWGGSYGAFHFGLALQPAPANDDFANRIPIEGLPTETGYTFHANATREPGEPLHPGSPLAGTLWWTWVSPLTGKIAVTNRGASYPLVAFYTGDSVSNLVLVAGGISSYHDVLPVSVQAGVAYQIAASAAGNLNLLLSEVTSIPPNDHFANAIRLEGTNASAEADNTFADREPTEPVHSTNSTGKTLWWTWTAPADGELHLPRAYEFTTTRAEAAIYTGNSLADLKLVGFTTNMQWESKYFLVAAGTTYHFALDTMDGGFGPFRWRFELGVTPTNDMFAGRQALPSTGATFAQALGTANREPREPALARGKTIGKTLWWTFTPPRDGTIRLSAKSLGASVTVALGAFTGSQLSGLKRRAEGGDEITLRVQRGVPYHLVADPVEWRHWYWGGHVSGLELTFQYDPVPSNDDFADRISLVGSSVAITNRNSSGSRQRGEPRHTSAPTLGATIWYEWIAPADGWVYLLGRGETFTPVMAVYEGNRLGSLKTVARSSTGLYYTSIAAFPVKAGRTYQIAADGLAAEGLTGSIELGLDFSTLRLTHPTNGSFHASASPLVLAINTPDETIDGPIAGIGYLLQHEWHGAQPIFSASSPPYTITASNLPAGRYVAVAFETNLQGQIHASPPVGFTLTPQGDTFGTRIALSGFQWHVTGDFAGATLEPGEPRHSGGRNSGSIWYSWTAPVSGPVECFFALPEHVNLSVYQGAELRRLKRLKVGSPNGWTRSFNAVAGVTYCFAITRSVKADYDYAGRYTLDLALRNLQMAGLPNGAIFTSDDIIPLNFSGTVAPDKIISIDYLEADTVIASSLTPPFGAAWSQMRPGDYTLRARARMQSGLELLTEPISLTVLLANDQFAGSKLLQGQLVSTNATLYGASLEPGEPRINGYYLADRSAWWHWTASESGRVWVNFIGSSGLATVSIYTGPAVNALSPVPIRYRGTISGVEFVAMAGTTYHIAASHAEPTEGLLTLRSIRPPENDLFAGRIRVSGTNLLLEGHNLEAARQPDEPLIPYGCGYSGRLVWWSWTAPGDGYTTVVNRPTHGGACLRIRAFVGETLESLVPVSSEDSHDSAAFNVVAGQAYQIAVDTSVEVEHLSLQLDFKPRPVNDDFVNRTVLSGTDFEFEANTVGATLETNEPPHQDFFAPASVWYTWTAPSAGEVWFTPLSEHSTIPVIAVYRGESLNELVPVSIGWSPQRFMALSNVTYQLAVGPYSSGSNEQIMRIGVTFVPTTPGPSTVLPVVASFADPAPAETNSPLELRSVGGFHFEVTGAPGQHFRIEASSDLSNWIPLMEDRIANGPFRFIDPNVARNPARFYRAVSLP